MKLWYTARRMIRSPAACASVVCVVGALCVLLLWLADMSSHQDALIDAAYDDIIIRCTVSDSKGNVNDIMINWGYVKNFTDDAYPLYNYISDPWFKQSVTYVISERPELSGALVGINNIRADLRLLPENGAMITYADGYSEESFKSDDDIVWLDKDYLDSLGLFVGDVLRLSVMGIERDFMIAGYYTPPASADMSADIYTSWNAPRRLAIEAGEGTSLDSLSFAVADNRKLQRFKELAAESFLSVDIYAAHPTDFRQSMLSALTIHDEIFTITLRAAQKNGFLLDLLIAALYFLSVAVGFLTSFIFTRNRKREIFLLFSFGLKRASILGMMCLEQAALAVTGAMIACLLSPDLASLTKAGVLCLSFLAGTVLSVLLIMRKSLLCRTEG